MKLIYFFGSGCSDGNSHKKDLLGGKGANLREMTNLNIPVPPGFTITTDVCKYFIDNGALPNELKEEVVSSVNKIEDIMMKKFGDTNNPLLVSVRSDRLCTLPGVMRKAKSSMTEQFNVLEKIIFVSQVRSPISPG